MESFRDYHIDINNHNTIHKMVVLMTRNNSFK